MIAQKLRLGVFALGFVAIAATVRIASAQEFRVDTEVFLGQEKNPILEQLTIFSEDGAIYDFRLTAPREATVFDPRRGLFTVLNEAKQIKATVTTQELLDYSLELESHAAESKNSLFSFCGAPKFETAAKEIDRNGQTVTEVRMVSRPLTYIAEGEKPQRVEAARTYRTFADWCARLNSTIPGSLPARARIELNLALAERDLLPLEITRSVLSPNPLGKKIEHRMQHRFNWKLSTEDQKKIENAGNMIAQFQLVSYNDYCELKAPTEKQAKR